MLQGFPPCDDRFRACTSQAGNLLEDSALCTPLYDEHQCLNVESITTGRDSNIVSPLYISAAEDKDAGGDKRSLSDNIHYISDARHTSGEQLAPVSSENVLPYIKSNITGSVGQKFLDYEKVRECMYFSSFNV